MNFLESVLEDQDPTTPPSEPTVEPSLPDAPIPPILTEPVPEPSPATPGLPTDPGNPATLVTVRGLGYKFNG